MKGSQELIAHFNKREAELGEKASKLNMFLEGYALGYNDTKEDMINKACKAFCDICDTCDGCNCVGLDKCEEIKTFRKLIEK